MAVERTTQFEFDRYNYVSFDLEQNKNEWTRFRTCVFFFQMGIKDEVMVTNTIFFLNFEFI